LSPPHVVSKIRTRARLYFTPHCLRHSFATALAPLIGGDAKTGAKILGHSPQTFMRYVGANDETARAAVEKMAEGLSMAGQLVAVPTTASALYVAGAEGLGLGFLMAGTERTRYRMVFSGEAHPIYAQTSNEITTRCAPFDSSTI